ncbi:hypothetical protein HK099_008048 [Clydaea vesicula]|uniref:F-box domain-containing protein n=1 Tax=Clydaea vesicula TaxID=447962 RepID=A0AAD5TVS4_9FUNG|nr:hypothetical protein HK099_008048 [Clydaea vesicula]KAJ3379981.1 hypothetical protein HDU92_006251 [Lobulomyces angularis]
MDLPIPTSLADDHLKLQQLFITNFENLQSNSLQIHSILKILLQKRNENDFTFLSQVFLNLKNLLKINFIDVLPIHLCVKILGYLDHKSLCRTAQLSKKWNLVSNDDSLWHRMCIQHIDKRCVRCGWCLPLLKRKRKLLDTDLRENDTESHKNKKICQQQTTNETKHTNNETNQHFVSNKKYLMPWKKVFSDRQRIESNWRSRKYVLKTLYGHSAPITCLKLDNDSNILISGSEDTTIRIWDLTKWSLRKVLTGHTDVVTCLQFDSTKLVSGSLDSTLRIWCLNKMECVKIFNHANKITCLHFVDKVLVSGSADFSVSVANLLTGRVFKLNGHTAAVTTVQLIESNRVISSSNDQTLKIWSLDTQEQLLNISSMNCITNFHFDNYKLITHSRFENNLKFFHIFNNKEENFKVLKFKNYILDFWIDKVRLLVLLDGFISVFQISGGSFESEPSSKNAINVEYQQVLELPDFGSKCCLLSDDKVVCGKNDVLIYDFGVNENN